jgi:hypothetical protein
MSERRSYSVHAVAEAIESYGVDPSTGPHTKLSISLPSDLVELVRGVATERGLSVSAVIGGTLRRTLQEADQARLDAAIDAQNEENLDWANAYLPIASKLWSELEW